MTFVLLVENAAELLKNYKLKMVAGEVFQICVYAVQIGSYMTTLFPFFFLKYPDKIGNEKTSTESQ